MERVSDWRRFPPDPPSVLTESPSRDEIRSVQARCSMSRRSSRRPRWCVRQGTGRASTAFRSGVRRHPESLEQAAIAQSPATQRLVFRGRAGFAVRGVNGPCMMNAACRPASICSRGSRGRQRLAHQEVQATGSGAHAQAALTVSCNPAKMPRLSIPCATTCWSSGSANSTSPCQRPSGAVSQMPRPQDAARSSPASLIGSCRRNSPQSPNA